MPKKRVVGRTWKITGKSGDKWFACALVRYVRICNECVCIFRTEVRSHTIYFNIFNQFTMAAKAAIAAAAVATTETLKPIQKD